jgi:molybdate transport system substrate-binding protein
MIKVAKLLLPLLGLVVFAAGCGNGNANSESKNGHGSDKKLTVFAAASLTESFNDMVKIFEKQTGADVSFSFAGTQSLRTQIEQGAPADVFVSANTDHMKAVQKEGLVKSYQPFVDNKMALIVPKHNPGDIHRFKDLATKDYKLILGVKNVPVGSYARKMLANAEKTYGPDFKKKVMSHAVSFETDTKQVANKVAMGEADAGIVYVTDITPDIAKKVEQVKIPDRLNLTTTDTIAVVKNAPHLKLAKRWVEFVLSDSGQKMLAKHHLVPVKKQR